MDSLVQNQTSQHISSPTTTTHKIRLSRKTLRRLSPFITFFVVMTAWQMIVWLEIYPRFIIPSPLDVAESLQESVADGSLIEHTMVTLHETVFGLLFGVGSAVLLGYAIARIPVLEDLLSPIIVMLQSTPTVAYAPLLIIWFGSGPTSKIITSAIIVFFPMLLNTVAGIRQVPTELHDLMKSLKASRWQIFTKLEVPAALPYLLAGLKTSATLAVIGAVVGEFVSAGSGLGFLVTLARNQYDTSLVIVAVFAMTMMALTFYSLVSFLEWRLLAWQRQANAKN